MQKCIAAYRLVLWVQPFSKGGGMNAKQSTVETMAKKALREMLRKACSGEHINASIESKITEQFYEAANAMASAYAASREFAWNGLIKEFTLCIDISASGMHMKAKSAPNTITENNDTEEMDLPPSHFCYCTCLSTCLIV